MWVHLHDDITGPPRQRRRPRNAMIYCGPMSLRNQPCSYNDFSVVCCMQEFSSFWEEIEHLQSQRQHFYYKLYRTFREREMVDGLVRKWDSNSGKRTWFQLFFIKILTGPLKMSWMHQLPFKSSPLNYQAPFSQKSLLTGISSELQEKDWAHEVL